MSADTTKPGKARNVVNIVGSELYLFIAVDWPEDINVTSTICARRVTVTHAALPARTAAAFGKTWIPGRPGSDALSLMADNLQRAINLHLYDPATGRFRDGKGVDHHALHASVFSTALGVANEKVLEEVGNIGFGRNVQLVSCKEQCGRGAGLPIQASTLQGPD